jgi:hypothetical protein
MTERFPEEASPDDVQALFDAIDTTLIFDDAMPQRPEDVLPDPFGIKGLEFHADPRNHVELIAIGGLKRLTVVRRADVADRATVYRELYKPELGPTAYNLEAYRLSKGGDGTPTISRITVTHLTEFETVTIDSLNASMSLEETTGGDRVPATDCQDVTRQISSTRVSPIQIYDGS